MTSDLANWINNLSDRQAVKFLAHFSQMLLDGLVNDVDQVLENIPLTLSSAPEFDRIKALAMGETEIELTDAETIDLTRQFLAVLLQDPATLPLLEEARAAFPQTGGKTGSLQQMLSVALAASTIILVATPEATFKVGETQIHKPSTSLELVTPLIGALTAAALVKSGTNSSEGK